MITLIVLPLTTFRLIDDSMTYSFVVLHLLQMYVHALYLNMWIMYVYLSSTAENGNQDGDGSGNDIYICANILRVSGFPIF
jgi:hypothetical protein